MKSKTKKTKNFDHLSGFTPKEIEDAWKNTKPSPHELNLTLDSTNYHKVIAFRDSDGQSFADSIELEVDALKRWRLEHYQERWMTKEDLEKYYQLILKIIKKL